MLKCLLSLLLCVAAAIATTAHAQKQQPPAANSCIISDASGALEIGNKIAHGSALTRQYAIILRNSELFQDPYYQVEPTHLAYAFYILAERADLPGARQKQEWLMPYIELEVRDKITSAIYKHYPLNYVRKCFAPRQKEVIDHNVDPRDFPAFLYMDGM